MGDLGGLLVGWGLEGDGDGGLVCWDGLRVLLRSAGVDGLMTISSLVMGLVTTDLKMISEVIVWLDEVVRTSVLDLGVVVPLNLLGNI